MAEYVIYADTASDSDKLWHKLAYLYPAHWRHRTSDQFELDDPNRDDFEPEATDNFPVTLPELGNLKEAYVKVEGSEKWVWHLLQVRIEKRGGQVVRSWSAYNPEDPSKGWLFGPDHIRGDHTQSELVSYQEGKAWQAASLTSPGVGTVTRRAPTEVRAPPAMRAARPSCIARWYSGCRARPAGPQRPAGHLARA
jgi:hypothetical protein